MFVHESLPDECSVRSARTVTSKRMRRCPEKKHFLTAAMPFRALVPEPKVRPLNAPSRSQFASAMDDITERESDWLLVVFGGTEAQCRD